jgi:predicted amidophosphoribosyltransferase
MVTFLIFAAMVAVVVVAVLSMEPQAFCPGCQRELDRYKGRTAPYCLWCGWEKL